MLARAPESEAHATHSPHTLTLTACPCSSEQASESECRSSTETQTCPSRHEVTDVTVEDDKRHNRRNRRSEACASGWKSAGANSLSPTPQHGFRELCSLLQHHPPWQLQHADLHHTPLHMPHSEARHAPHSYLLVFCSAGVPPTPETSPNSPVPVLWRGLTWARHTLGLKRDRRLAQRPPIPGATAFQGIRRGDSRTRV